MHRNNITTSREQNGIVFPLKVTFNIGATISIKVNLSHYFCIKMKHKILATLQKNFTSQDICLFPPLSEHFVKKKTKKKPKTQTSCFS